MSHRLRPLHTVVVGALVAAALTTAGVSSAAGPIAGTPQGIGGPPQGIGGTPPGGDRPSAPASGLQGSASWGLASQARSVVPSGEPDPDAVQVRGDRHTYATLALPVMESVLSAAPDEDAEALPGPAARSVGDVVELPTPEGGVARFSIVESPVVEPALAAKYPEVTTYAGVGIDDPAASVRLDLGPNGFHAQVLSPNGRWYIDPARHMDTSRYISYFGLDLVNRHGDFVEHGVLDRTGAEITETAAEAAGRSTTGARSSGSKLTTYRLAIATTGEYSAYFGGTKAKVHAELVTAVNRVTGIYELELAARLKLVANNDDLIALNASSDGLSNNDAGAILPQLQTKIDAVIGPDNYDIGHGFSTGAGGLAYLGVIGDPDYKSRGVTGTSAPTGDAYWVDYVAHELGHQFGGHHTFNGSHGSCSGGNADLGHDVEPGSGSTIQAYAGICGTDDLQPHSDPYFHAVSYDEMRVEMADAKSRYGSGRVTSTRNSVPDVSVVGGNSFVIPPRTPFALTASGEDTDGDHLTYTWEQYDTGAQRALDDPSKPNGPLFRSRPPSGSPTRYFPSLSSIASGATNAASGNCTALPGGLDCWVEFLPTAKRSMTFRATVRDNARGGGGVNSATATVLVRGSTRFRVTGPDGGETLTGRATTGVAWAVAGTSGGAVDTPRVDILWSSDGGKSFPTVLAAGVPNDGSQSVLLPSAATNKGRIMVRGAGNIFFDTSDSNIVLLAGSGVPDAPTGVAGRPGNGRVAVSWKRPADTGGLTITQYTVKASPGGRTCSTSGTTNCTITGLRNGNDYRFVVKARNSAGFSAWSDKSRSVTPRTVPGKPRDVKATARVHKATVSWRAPRTDGGSPIIKYQVIASPGGRHCTTKASRSCTVTKLSTGTRYSFQVRARNAAGWGARSSASAEVKVL